MGDRFVISDTHFGHANICKFQNFDGSKVRPFDDVNVMDETMVERWNAIVKPGDTVYHLGDVVIARRNLAYMTRLNGRKVLVKGNHDIFKLSDYTPHFVDIRSCMVKDGIFFSHVPIHVDCLMRFGVNVHGHLHGNFVNDGRYLNVCVENTDYAPLPWDELLKKVEKARETVPVSG